jgi:fatty acid desaturase
MLKNRADLKTLVYIVVITGLLVVQWRIGEVVWPLWIFAMFMSVPVAVIAHNHNHLPMWDSKVMNALTDYWLTLFYGYPAFGWIPTHNTNHHVHNNRAADYTSTFRYTEKTNLLTLLSYPTLSGGIQQKANTEFIKETWRTNRRRAWYYLSEAALLLVYLAVAFWWDGRKAFWFIFLPQQFSLFSVLIFNYIQHVHADEESKWNHSRNFVGWFLNWWLFNNGYHTVHHMHPRRHWSENKAAHEAIAGNIDPRLNEPSFWWFHLRTYFLGAVFDRFRSKSMRLARLAAAQGA